jgi:hypothetical protein
MEHLYWCVGDHHIQTWWPSNLTPKQHILQFILYMKHDNACMNDFFYETRQKTWCVMMLFSLHLASTMHLLMRFDGPQYMKDICWVPPYQNFKATLG